MADFFKHIETVEASLAVKLNSMRKYNVLIHETKRTSVTLEPIVWEILHEIAQEQGCDVNDLCSFIDKRKQEGANLSSAIRVFLISYLFINKRQSHG